MPARPIGTLIRKIQCQVKKVVMKPPTGGPTSGPIRPGMVSQAMAETRSLLGGRAHQHQPRDRRHHRAAHALQEARQRRSATSEPDDGAGDRADDEDGDGRAEDALGAEPVGHPAR